MLFKSSVFKLILGSLSILGLAAATGVIYKFYVKPLAPTYFNVTLPANVGAVCEPMITFRDNSTNEDDFRLYRRNFGTIPFTLIYIFPASPGIGKEFSYTDLALPIGSYEYKVSAYNQLGESFSGIMPITIVPSTFCAQVVYQDPVKLPLNPIIVSLSILNDCSVRISYRDNSTNEQGLKIYRSQYSSEPYVTLLNTLGPHAGIPGTYDDNTRLPPGTYGYRIFAYNQNGETSSNGENIEVTSICNPTMKFAPTVDALVFPTAQKQSTGTCHWTAVENAFLRKGPDVGLYDRLLPVEAGQGFPIVGQSEDGQFWAVETGLGVGYITKSETYSRTDGDCSSVPTLPDPPPPVIHVAPTKKPGGTNGDSATATPCPIGMVCP